MATNHSTQASLPLLPPNQKQKTNYASVYVYRGEKQQQQFAAAGELTTPCNSIPNAVWHDSQVGCSPGRADSLND